MESRDDEDRWVKFGKWVQQERLKIINEKDGKPISQGEAGRRAKSLSRTHWQRIETGDTGTKYTTIPLIARGLGRTTPAEIREVHERAGFVSGESTALPAAIEHFKDLSPEAQQDIARMIQRLYESEQPQKPKTPGAQARLKAKGRGAK